MTARAIVEEPLEIHGVGDRAARARRAAEILELVGIPAGQHVRKPHAFSGGQRQRIGVARALVLEPGAGVPRRADVGARRLRPGADPQPARAAAGELPLTYVFIVHDLAVAEYFCDRVAVLYRGAVMETRGSDALFHEPLHPYTIALLSAVPVPDPDVERRRRHVVLRGDVGVDASRRRLPVPPALPGRARSRDLRARGAAARRAPAGARRGVPLPRRAPGPGGGVSRPGRRRHRWRWTASACRRASAWP